MSFAFPKKVKENNNKLFKKTSYDIRAYVGEPGDFFNDKAVLTPEAMEAAGMMTAGLVFKTQDGGTVSLKEGDTIVVGYDNGPTSKVLAESFAKGAAGQGVNVYNIGISSSGQVYQNQEQLSAQGHCQITRSHVEVTTNGAKFGIGTQGIHTYLLGQMNEAVAEDKFSPRQCKAGTITDKTAEGKKVYFEKMKKIYKDYYSKRDNSMVAVNVFGGTGLEYIDLFKDIFGDKVTILGTDINVNAGDLLADPTRKEMLERVPALQAALDKGLRVHSFDLDADRGSITEGSEALTLNGEGHYLGDNLAFILAGYKLTIAVPALRKKLEELNISKEKIDEIIKIASIIYVDPRYTSSVKSYVEKELKGTTEFHRKGHSLWKETITANMKKMASLAGFSSIKEFVAKTGYRDIQIEASLHMFSTDTMDGIPRDDAVENIFLLEKVLDEMGIKKLKPFFDKMPKRYITKEIRTTSVSNEAKDAITESILTKIRKTFDGRKGFSIVEFDGQIRVDWSTGFLMYGMSNTSPKLTFMAEGETVKERNMVLAYIMALHNEAKKAEHDNLPMDLSENPFYVKDASYEMSKPDEIDFNDERVKEFIKFIG
ncbi:MAG: hypothetical protein SPF17_03400 [Candidatus Mucispirillum faecigallinarum]|nr:hypothetical protein [Candidatus Mucispirillum faecigallinarum]